MSLLEKLLAWFSGLSPSPEASPPVWQNPPAPKSKPTTPFITAFVKPKRTVKRVFIHCSASDNPEHDDIAVIREWHIDRGFTDAGYHYFICRDGTIQAGRDIERQPAAQAPHNFQTIAICVHGLDTFSGAQMKALRRMCLAIDAKYEGKISFHGHCEVSPKECPVFDYKDVLSLDDEGFISPS